jgi:hypothetical protein
LELTPQPHTTLETLYGCLELTPWQQLRCGDKLQAIVEKHQHILGKGLAAEVVSAYQRQLSRNLLSCPAPGCLTLLLLPLPLSPARTIRTLALTS